MPPVTGARGHRSRRRGTRPSSLPRASIHHHASGQAGSNRVSPPRGPGRVHHHACCQTHRFALATATRSTGPIHRTGPNTIRPGDRLDRIARISNAHYRAVWAGVRRSRNVQHPDRGPDPEVMCFGIFRTLPTKSTGRTATHASPYFPPTGQTDTVCGSVHPAAEPLVALPNKHDAGIAHGAAAPLG